MLGHRGASAHAPGNSLEALRLAVVQGADGFEVDVRFTADGHVVLHHDPVVPGLGPLVAHTLPELRAERPYLSTLDDLLAVPGRPLLDVEIKNHPGDPDFDPDHRMAEFITDWVDTNGVADRILVSSFNPGTIGRVRELAPELPVGLLLEHGFGILEEVEGAAAAGYTWLFPRKSALRLRPKRVLRRVRDTGLRLGTWTVDARWELRRLRRVGVDAVITNVPGRALADYS